MKYAVYLFDDSYHVVDEKNYTNGISDVEQAMITKSPVQLGKALVAGSAISKIEELGASDYGPHIAQIASDFTQASALLEGYQKTTISERDQKIYEIKQEIRERMKKIGGTSYEQRQYVANIQLAKRLHPESKDWNVRDWDEFIENHKHPYEELEYLEIQDRLPV